jgi:hypothetical protein
MRRGVISNTIPEKLIFIVNKCILVNRVVVGEWALQNRDGKLVEDHIVPIFPIQRRTISTMAKTNTRNMEMRNIPRNTTIGEPES